MNDVMEQVTTMVFFLAFFASTVAIFVVWRCKR